MLILNKSDIKRAVSPQELLDAVEKALIIYERKEFQMPDRMHANYENNTLLLMPCFTPSKFGTKLVSLFPENTKKNLPVLFGTMILNDGETGEPLALLNGSTLTALRTGAVGGTGIRLLAPDDVETLGIIGTGVQGFHQAIFGCTVRKISDVFIYDTNKNCIKSFNEKLIHQFPEVKIHVTKSSQELLENSQVVVTTTNSLKPVLPEKPEMLEGKSFIGIGSYKPNMREFPDSLFPLLENIFIDADFGKEESGDLVVPLKSNWISERQVFTLGKILTGRMKVNQKSTTFFKSVGMALFDLVVSDLIYQKSMERGLGIEINL